MVFRNSFDAKALSKVGATVASLNRLPHWWGSFPAAIRFQQALILEMRHRLRDAVREDDAVVCSIIYNRPAANLCDAVIRLPFTRFVQDDNSATLELACALGGQTKRICTNRTTLHAI